MGARFFLFILSLTFTLHSQARIIYVQLNAPGDGSSWERAMPNLQTALGMAKTDDQVWVARGVYFPTDNQDRSVSFHLKDGVTLYGSFAGFETDIEQRNIAENYSVLSGEIGNSSKTDNTLNVLYSDCVSINTIVDGFIITGGYADGAGLMGDRSSSGGGMYNFGSSTCTSSGPTIINCRFIDNTARDGGAIYNFADIKGECKPVISNCVFQNNTAFLGGGAIFNNANNQGKCITKIADNHFMSNSAGFGGAVFNLSQNGICQTIIENSRFAKNKAMIQGGGIFNAGINGNSYTKLNTKCEFLENMAPKGSAMANIRELSTSDKNLVKL